MDTKKVGTFLKEINGANWVYLELVVGIRSNLENLRNRSGLDAQQFAKELNISIKELDDFMLGNYEYKLDDICAINFLAKQIEEIKNNETSPMKDSAVAVKTKKPNIELRWSGTMGMGKIKKPIIQQLQPNVYCAVRMSGMGVAIAPIVAQRAVKLMKH